MKKEKETQIERNNKIQLFYEKSIRTVWDDENEKWWFCVVDVVAALTDSANPTDYLKKMRKRDAELGAYLGTNCPHVEMVTGTGVKRKTLAADTEGILRIIQSIPSPKAEPFKRWMAQVASEVLDELDDPELTIDRAMWEYKRLGYSDAWINQRLKSIEVRKGLTDEWKRGGMKEGVQFARLTDIISKTWSGLTTKEYKNLKGLKKENLRDNMTNTELVLNMLAETAATDLSKEKNPQNFFENAVIANEGGSVAKAARDQLEQKLGHSVVTSLNAKEGIGQTKKMEIENDSEAEE